jgi:ketosteroid isomerase-like protein
LRICHTQNDPDRGN